MDQQDLVTGQNGLSRIVRITQDCGGGKRNDDPLTSGFVCGISMLVETILASVDWKCLIKSSVGICVIQSKYIVPPTSYFACFIIDAWSRGARGGRGGGRRGR